MIAASGRVTSDVTESPNSLLPDVENWRRKEVDELWHCTSLNDDLSMVSRPRCDVSQGPSSFKLIKRKKPC